MTVTVTTQSLQDLLDRLVADAASNQEWFGGMTWRGQLTDSTDTVAVRFEDGIHILEVNPAEFAELVVRGEGDLFVLDEMRNFVALQVEVAIDQLLHTTGVEI